MIEASKENCREVMRRLVIEGNTPNTTLLDVDYRFMIDFLLAAEKRLPSADAIAKDKERKRPVAAGVVCNCPSKFCPAHGAE